MSKDNPLPPGLEVADLMYNASRRDLKTPIDNEEYKRMQLLSWAVLIREQNSMSYRIKEQNDKLEKLLQKMGVK